MVKCKSSDYQRLQVGACGHRNTYFIYLFQIYGKSLQTIFNTKNKLQKNKENNIEVIN